jgi:hypothetical protein
MCLVIQGLSTCTGVHRNATSWQVTFQCPVASAGATYDLLSVTNRDLRVSR